jgi:ferredoxin
MDFISQVRKTLKIGYWNLPDWLNKSLHRLRYVIFVVILLPPFLLFFLDPLYPQKWASALFLIGSFTPVTILLGPLEPLIVPWGETLGFSGLSLSYPYIRQVIVYSSGIFVSINVFIVIALTVASSFAVRRFWCRFCPSGISIGIVNHLPHFKWVPIMHLNKVEEKCTKCGICKRVCLLQVTEVYDQKGGDIATSMCMLCLRCVEMCPYEDCLKANFNGKSFFKSRNWLKNRATGENSK